MTALCWEVIGNFYRGGAVRGGRGDLVGNVEVWCRELRGGGVRGWSFGGGVEVLRG